MLAGNDIRHTDELDKMSGTTRSLLLEVIEQQILSIAETGIICQLSVRTPLLTTADPCEPRWNRDIIENTELPHTPTWCRLTILLMRQEGETMDKGDQRNYIAYTKPNFQSVMTDLASQRHISGYAVMGRVGSGIGSEHDLPLLVGSLTRLAETHVKVRFWASVELPEVVGGVATAPRGPQAGGCRPDLWLYCHSPS